MSSMLTTLLLADVQKKKKSKKTDELDKGVPGVPHPHRGHPAHGALRVRPNRVKAPSFHTKL